MNYDIQTHKTPTLNVVALMVATAALSLTLHGCQSTPRQPDPDETQIAQGRDIFFNETFNGNGRTCGTCHRVEDNFGLTPGFIATLPQDDPLFVAEFNPALAKGFEKPALMREFGLIVENQDGFNDLENNFNLRGIPHVLALRTSVDSAQGPRTGWSGDGAPGDGTLRSFATGAVIQHFPKTLNRNPGVDFRLPTDTELDAMELFMLSLGRQQDLVLPLALRGTVASRGQAIFIDNSLGKCNLCHVNAGATADFGGGNLGNANFDTGVENLPDQPAVLTGERVPPDDGFGSPGDGTFNTPPLVEAADTGPFFHNNAIETIEGAVAFYNSDAFNNSPSGNILAGLDPNGVGIKLDATQIVAVAAFLRVINALENIRASLELLNAVSRVDFPGREKSRSLIEQATHETEDSLRVLESGGLHAQAVVHLRTALRIEKKALHGHFFSKKYTRNARHALKQARDELVVPSS